MTENEISESPARLDAEVSRYRERHEADSADPPQPVTIPIGDALSAQLASFGRMKERWTEYCESMRSEFDALPPAKACSSHPDVMRPKLFEETCQRSRLEERFTPAWGACPACAAEGTQTKARRFWSKRGVPERVVDATLANFSADLEEKVMAVGKVRAWLKRNGVFLLLAGTTGTGKGHLAAGCLKVQGNGLFITHVDMLTDLRASYTLHTTKEVIERWQEAEMLVLDEFGLSAGGKDEEPMLYQVLADRYDKRRPTIITSNLDIPQLREAIGYRLLDRMTEDCATVICRWESWRKAMTSPAR